MAALLGVLPPICATAQAPSAFPVDVSIPRAPQPVMADGRLRLPYELHLTNYSPRTVELLIPVDGKARFAVYAHLQPGSLKVKLGDRVRAGQALALLGNSGNSDAPHLHFQLVDANSPLGAEGIPYEFEQFDQPGVAGGPDVLDGGAAGNTTGHAASGPTLTNEADSANPDVACLGTPDTLP
jgi:hypothetical protein